MTNVLNQFPVSNAQIGRISIVVLLSVLFAELGFQVPEKMGFTVAFLLWVCVLGTFTILLLSIFNCFKALVPSRENTRLWSVGIFFSSILLTVLPVSLMFVLLGTIAPEIDVGGYNFSAREYFGKAWLDEYFGILPTSALLGILMIGFGLIPENVRKTSLPVSLSSDTEGNSLMNRFKELQSMDIWALQADEHYVLVHGNTDFPKQIFYKFKHAVEDIHQSNGLQVHRSWWVSESGINRVVQFGRNYKIFLKNNIEVPVSSRRISEFKGWLDQNNIKIEKQPV